MVFVAHELTAFPTPNPDKNQLVVVGPVVMWAKASMSPCCAATLGQRSRSAQRIVHMSRQAVKRGRFAEVVIRDTVTATRNRRPGTGSKRMSRNSDKSNDAVIFCGRAHRWIVASPGPAPARRAVILDFGKLWENRM